MRDGMCESCGSNIGSNTQLPNSRIHLCSIKTATGWRQEIPLHSRAAAFKGGIATKLNPTDARDWKLYEIWLDKHQGEADEIVCDIRSGMIISAVYYNPVAMHTSERLDFFANVQKLSPFEEEK